MGFFNVFFKKNPYDIGDIYITTNTINPADRFGGGWQKLTGKFLIGADDSTYVIGKEGGNADGMHTLTVAELPEVINEFRARRTDNTTSPYTIGEISTGHVTITQSVATGTYIITSESGKKKPMDVVSLTNGGQNKPHSIMPPYYPVYMWIRTS